MATINGDHTNKPDQFINKVILGGTISSTVLYCCTLIVFIVAYYYKQKKKEATYYGLEDRLDEEFFKKNPKYIKQKEQIEVCHIMNEDHLVKSNSVRSITDGCSIKILMKKISKTNCLSVNPLGSPTIDSPSIPEVLNSFSYLTAIEAIIDIDLTKHGFEVLETVQRHIKERIMKAPYKDKKALTSHKVCGMVVNDTRHVLEQITEELWIVHGGKPDNSFFSSGLHNLHEPAINLSLHFTMSLVKPERCNIFAYKVLKSAHSGRRNNNIELPTIVLNHGIREQINVEKEVLLNLDVTPASRSISVKNILNVEDTQRLTNNT